MTSAIPSKVFAINNLNLQEAPAACIACSRKTACPAAGTSTQKVVRAGKNACAAGDDFDGVYIVRSGFFKSFTIETDGTLQITGFYLPGECFGLDAIGNGVHREYVEALDTSSVCKIPAGALGSLEENRCEEFSPRLGMFLMRLMSSTIGRDHKWFFNLGKMSARERFSHFLLDLSERMAQSGYSGQHFRLCMSRSDIANYLCLALETVSRLFTQLHAEGVIAVDRRDIRILDRRALAMERASAVVPADAQRARAARMSSAA